MKHAYHAVITLLGVDITSGRQTQLCFAYLQMEAFSSDGCRASWLALMRTTSGLRCAMTMGKRSGSVSPRSASGVLHSCRHTPGACSPCMFACLAIRRTCNKARHKLITICCYHSHLQDCDQLLTQLVAVMPVWNIAFNWLLTNVCLQSVTYVLLRMHAS